MTAILSSMATRQVLGELAEAYAAAGGEPVALESVGGVDAARRVDAGEPFDVVILASDAIDKLAAAGRVHARVDLVRSGVAVAVRAGAPRPDISSEASLRDAVLAADRVGYSTGPSGTALLKLFERWGIADRMRERAMQAPPGVPVGTLLAEGRVTLGFQQASELMHLPGISVLGGMPEPVQILTIFSGAVCATARHPDEARKLLAFLASPAAEAAKRRHGMEPA